MPLPRSKKPLRPPSLFAGGKKLRSWAALPESEKIRGRFNQGVVHGKKVDRRAVRKKEQLLKRLMPKLEARAKARSAYFKANKTDPSKMTDYSLINPVASTVIYARDPVSRKIFVFVAERNPAHTKTWPGAKVLGGTGKLKAGELGYKHALRELKEELGIQEHQIDAIQSVAPVDFAKHAGEGKAYLKGHNYLARVPMTVLQQSVERLNRENGEAHHARIISLQELEELENLQPHYELIRKRVIQFLKKEKVQ